MAPSSIPNYRTRILAQLFRAVIVPPLFFATLPLPRLWSALLCILSIPIVMTARTLWDTYSQERAAERLGARLVTRVRGRYPGNIDILLSLVKSSNKSYIFEFHSKMFEQYGERTLNLRLLWEDTIITIEEKHVKFILATAFDSFEKGYWVREKMERLLGNGIFNRDGEEWKAHRSLTRPFFARERISDFDIFDKYTDETLHVLSRASAQPYSSLGGTDSVELWERAVTPVDVQDLFLRFTLDSASTFLFGACTETLKGPLPEAGHALMGTKGSRTDDAFGSFASAFEEAQTHIKMRFRYGNILWPLFELIHDKTSPSIRVIKEWLDPMVHRAIARREERRENGIEDGEATVFLEHLAGSSDDKNYIRNELLNILLASRDTTAALLTYTTYFLAMHPDVAERLRTEVLEQAGVDGTPTYDVMRGMRYMRAVLNETLRLFPPVPINSRQSVRPVVIPAHTKGEKGLYVPAGTPVIFVTLLIHRRTDLWGDDAAAFDPERWLDGRLARQTENPLMFAPFHAGPRICLGQNFAYNEASYFLIKLLQQYDRFSLARDAQPQESQPPAAWRGSSEGRKGIEKAWPESAFTLYARGGMWLRLRRAEEK